MKGMTRKIFSIVISIIITISYSGVQASGLKCPYPSAYIEIDRAYHECKKGWVKKGSSCDLFVEKLPLLFSKYDCQRSFDNSPVPALWLFGAAGEDYIEMLYQLALGEKGRFSSHWFSKAHERSKELFLHDEFKAVLDGALAEEYYPLIEAMKRNAP